MTRAALLTLLALPAQAAQTESEPHVDIGDNLG